MTVVLREWETFAGSNTPVVGATVNARVASSSHPSVAAIVASTTTNASGMWEFTALADATYDIDITYNGRTRWRKGNSKFSNSLDGANFGTQTANKIFAGPTSGGAAIPTFRDHVSADFPAALWATSNPTAFTQLGAVSFTVNRARLLLMGKFFIYVVQLTTTGATGTTANVIVITIPFSISAAAGHAIGTFRYDRVAPATHVGTVHVSGSATTVVFMVPTLGFLGVSPAFAEAIGDTLWFTIQGETT